MVLHLVVQLKRLFIIHSFDSAKQRRIFALVVGAVRWDDAVQND